MEEERGLREHFRAPLLPRGDVSLRKDRNITQLAMVIGGLPAALTAMIMLPSAENAAMGAHSSNIRQAIADPR
jgi:hypothetical protein